MPGARSTLPCSGDRLLIATWPVVDLAPNHVFEFASWAYAGTNSFRLDSPGNRLWDLHPDLLGSAFTEEPHK